ncbi:hypothetical protein BaRGS_00033712 [Batillaria attramentaria]|uniref:Uncharacterized protein n=1 Tax=Batillaria attramentaria TaxID=370345 RepID=A0ABD0JJE8_9CAEN
MDRNSDSFTSPFHRPGALSMAASPHVPQPHMPSSKTLKGILAGKPRSRRHFTIWATAFAAWQGVCPACGRVCLRSAYTA